MYKLNVRTKQVFELMREYSLKYETDPMSNVFLILAMFEIEDSLCHFLLDDYEVSREKIEEKTLKLISNNEYDASMDTIVEQAKEIAGARAFSEEELFMAVLKNRNTKACAVLEALGFDIDELIEDVQEIYDFDSTSNQNFVFRNITFDAVNNSLDYYVDRNDYLERLDIILHRKNKIIPLLIGNAGVGKTAIVEGYARKLALEKVNVAIYSLNLSCMLADVYSRDYFEELFDSFIKSIVSKKNVIIFIDEIHKIIGTGEKNGNLDVANMLKPFLSRNGIKLIGATTLEEYRKTIEKDKNVARKFQTIFIDEPTLDETMQIMLGIKKDYEAYHRVQINDDVLEYLIEKSDKAITNKYRPEKCIDVLDEMLARAHIESKAFVTKSDVDDEIQTYVSKKN